MCEWLKIYDECELVCECECDNVFDFCRFDGEYVARRSRVSVRRVY